MAPVHPADRYVSRYTPALFRRPGITGGNLTNTVASGGNAVILPRRDITTVWARGNLSGAITAGRNAGTATDTGLLASPAYPIFSYGQISADITALNPVGLTGGGHIGPVVAWGSIGGRFEAADTIHEIRSGDSVTAILIAPNVPVPIEFDATIETDYPLPSRRLPPNWPDCRMRWRTVRTACRRIAIRCSRHAATATLKQPAWRRKSKQR
jgi:hypothetical protein